MKMMQKDTKGTRVKSKGEKSEAYLDTLGTFLGCDLHSILFYFSKLSTFTL